MCKDIRCVGAIKVDKSWAITIPSWHLVLHPRKFEEGAEGSSKQQHHFDKLVTR